MEDRSGFYDDEFEVLETMIDENVTCIWNNRGVREGIRGKLHTVIPYDLVRVGSNLIPFVSGFIAIEAIFDRNGKEVYRNYKASKYKGCSLRSPMDLVNEQKDILGYSVAWEEIESHSKAHRAVR